MAFKVTIKLNTTSDVKNLGAWERAHQRRHGNKLMFGAKPGKVGARLQAPAQWVLRIVEETS
jgi:ribosomal protein L19E